MKKKMLSLIIPLLALSTEAWGANIGMMTSPPTLFSFFVLVIAGFCLFWSYQIWHQVKGGMLSRSWQMFLLGFLLLAVSQLLNVLTSTEIVVIPGFVSPGLLFV